jgi:hypothetical protein
MQPIRLVRHSAVFAVLLLAGCSHLRDVSKEPPYPPYVGQVIPLTCDCMLWDDDCIFPAERFLPPAPPTQKPLAQLPKGTPLKLERVQRETVYGLIGGWRGYDRAVVSFEDPLSRGKSCSATVQLEYLGISEKAWGPGNK